MQGKVANKKRFVTKMTLEIRCSQSPLYGRLCSRMEGSPLPWKHRIDAGKRYHVPLPLTAVMPEFQDLSPETVGR